VQLVDTRTDRRLWDQSYDRDIADVFAIQSEIAKRIAEQLQAKLSPAERAAIAERPTADLAAYAYGDLRFNSCWDSLRGDKRFDKIVAAAGAASN
jgi:hypothetical protein